MKKDGIQTRNRKLSAKSKKKRGSVMMDFFSPFDKPFGTFRYNFHVWEPNLILKYFSPHMTGMSSHPLGSPMSSYYSAGMSSMPGLSPNFGMPVSMSMYSASSQSPMSMGMSSMSGLGTTSMTSQGGPGPVSSAAYPSTSSPYPGKSSNTSNTSTLG